VGGGCEQENLRKEQERQEHIMTQDKTSIVIKRKRERQANNGDRHDERERDKQKHRREVCKCVQCRGRMQFGV
jgi:hypothetical protein